MGDCNLSISLFHLKFNNLVGNNLKNLKVMKDRTILVLMRGKIKARYLGLRSSESFKFLKRMLLLAYNTKDYDKVLCLARSDVIHHEIS